MSGQKAQIHSLESFATLDGDGIRYAVFFAGCNMRCIYCHNPDTWQNVGAYAYTADELYAKIKRYKPYFKTNGGVTLSGGEPLLHAEFICELSELLLAGGIKYALDTSGSLDIDEYVKKAVANADLIILDIKYWDKESYKKYANGDFDKVVAFGDFVQKLGKRTWLRTVITPDINDTDEALQKYAKIAKRWTCIEKYELLAFHTMGFDKYKRLGIVNLLEGKSGISEEQIAGLQARFDKMRNE